MNVRGLVLSVVAGLLPCVAVAQGTKVWNVQQYDEMERGQAQGVAIRSDGRLEPGPSTSLLYQTTGNYVWSVAADAAGNAYLAMGGTTAGGAVVMRVTPDGKAAKIFAGKELGVQAIRALPGGGLLIATNPDGKVYRLRPGAAPAATGAGKIPEDSGPYEAEVIFDPAKTEEKPKYVWDVASDGARTFIATGAPAGVYEVDLPAPSAGPSATAPRLMFRTVDQHVRCLLLSPDRKTLWAGTDGSGVIYKEAIAGPKDAPAKPFAAYAATKREITSLAMDPAGNLYASGVGARTAANATQPGLPPLPVTGAVGVTVTFSQPGSTNAAQANTLIPDGSEIYRIAPDGVPAKLLTLKDDVVYALAYDDGALLAATGNRGRIYRVDVGPHGGGAGRFTDVAHLEAAQAMAFAAIPGGQILATSNSGKVYRVDDHPAPNETYTSEVFDAGVYAKWGRVEARGAEGYDLFERTGNVESPILGWSDWASVGKAGEVSVPSGRFAQWKAVLHTGAALDSVGLNYLEKNLAPVVDDVVVQPGARVAAAVPATANATVQVSFPSPAATPVPIFATDANTQPLTAQKDRTGITVRWAGHDDNGDDLMFSVWYRGTGEKNWRLLRDNITERYLSFDAELLPDGPYEMKVIASDAPDHTDADTLTSERVSSEFVVDTTPPVPGVLTATLEPLPESRATAGAPPAQAIHAVFSAKDATSPIAHAEYSVDAGPWQYIEPVGGVSDSFEEHYNFVAPLPVASLGSAASGTSDPREHVIAVRVYDRAENATSAKAVVR